LGHGPLVSGGLHAGMGTLALAQDIRDPAAYSHPTPTELRMPNQPSIPFPMPFAHLAEAWSWADAGSASTRAWLDWQRSLWQPWWDLQAQWLQPWLGVWPAFAAWPVTPARGGEQLA
jgi:hypothetical protein